ncbi:MAG TPA: FG-GAP repeat protein [Prosthecobacter sp.]
MKNRFLFCSVLLLSLSSTQLKALEPNLQKLFPLPPAAGGKPAFGKAVATTEKFILVGTPDDDSKAVDAGAVYVHDAKTGKRLRKLLADDGAAGDAFGTAVAVSGNLAVVGAVKADAGRSAVYVFDLKTGKPLRKLVGTASPVEQGEPDRFGFSVAVEGSTVLIGSPGDDTGAGGVDAGSVYSMDALTGLLLAKVRLQGNFGTSHAGAAFGTSVDLSGNLAAVGAPNASANGKVGAGVVQLLDASSGQNLPRVSVSEVAAGDAFGTSVALHGNNLLVGAPRADRGAQTDAGNAYLVDVSTLSFIRLNPVQAFPAEQMGSAVALQGNLAAVASANGVLRGQAAGTVTLFDLTTGAPLRGLNAADMPGDARYGSGVAMAANHVVIGSPGDNDAGADAGAVYVFKPVSGPVGVSTLAQKGDPAPGAPEAVFAGFSSYHITADSVPQVLLQASVSGPGSSGGRTAGVWSRIGGGGLDLSLRLADPVNTQANAPKIAAITSPVNSFVGGVSYYAKVKGSGIKTENDEVWVVDNGSQSTFMVSEGTAPLGGGLTGQAIGSLGPLVGSGSQLRAAMVVGLRSTLAKTVTTAGDSAALVFSLQSDTPVGAIVEGEASPVAGVNYGQVGPRIAMGGTHVLVPVSLVSGTTAVTQADNAGLVQLNGSNTASMLARKGGNAPGTGGTFNAFLGEAMSPSNGFIFRASLSGVSAKENEALFRTGINLINFFAQKGKQVAGMPEGIVYAAFLKYWSTDQGDFVLAKVSGPGVTAANDVVLLTNLSAGFPTRVLMREGDIAPDCGGARIGLIQKVEVDRRTGHYAIITTLSDSDAASSQALWTGRAALSFPNNSFELDKPRLRLRRGSFQGLGSSTAALTTIDFTLPADPTGAGNRGFGSPLAGNTVALVLTFANKQVLAGPLAPLPGDAVDPQEPEVP